MRSANRDSTEDLTCLDALAASAEDLSRLETLIGGFNVFDALGVARAEIRHSNFLAWLIDPLESHKAGAEFLVDLVATLQRRQKVVADDELETLRHALSRAEVRREWRSIDVLVTSRAAALVLAIENKIDSREHSNQLSRYESDVRSQFPKYGAVLVYLTPDRSTPSLKSWIPLDYAELFAIIHRTFHRIRHRLQRDVVTFIEHYLRLVKTAIMNDESLDERCLELYRQHRRAINLINTRVRSLMSRRLVEQLRSLINADERWQLINSRPLAVDFVARAWSRVMPAWGSREGYRGTNWLTLSFRCDEDFRAVRFELVLWEFDDDELRQRVFEALQRCPNLCGRSGRYGKSFKVLVKEDVKLLDDEDLSDPEHIVSDLQGKLDQIAILISPIEASLAPLFAPEC